MKNFFIIGCPRSGTTMLQQALNRHSQIVIPPETKFFFSFLGHSRSCQLSHLRRINADLAIDLAAPSRPIRSTHDARRFFDGMANLYVRRLKRHGVILFGEKTPEHSGQIHRIRHVFPDAKILFLYRDGRDVALSLRKVPWMSSNLYVNFLIWLHYYRILVRTRDEALSNVMFVRYEDVVGNPEEMFRAVLSFLDLPYEPAVSMGYGNREGIPDREYAWKARALGKITSRFVGSWKHELSAPEVACLERLGGGALQSLGYDLATAGNGPLCRGFCLSTAWGLLDLFYRLPWHSISNELLGRSVCC
jgi:hypothetical protein